MNLSILKKVYQKYSRSILNNGNYYLQVKNLPTMLRNLLITILYFNPLINAQFVNFLRYIRYISNDEGYLYNNGAILKLNMPTEIKYSDKFSKYVTIYIEADYDLDIQIYCYQNAKKLQQQKYCKMKSVLGEKISNEFCHWQIVMNKVVAYIGQLSLKCLQYLL